MANQLASLGAETGWFGRVLTIAGELKEPPSPLHTPGDLVVLVCVQRIQPAPISRSVSSPSSAAPASLRAQAHVAVRFVGDAAPVGLAPRVQGAATGAPFHTVDLAALLLLAQLRERTGPAPDAEEPAHLDRPTGIATVAEGPRSASLAWTALQMGESTISINASGERQWDVPLVVDCLFQLSPLALEGGRILAVDAILGVKLADYPQQRINRYADISGVGLSSFPAIPPAVLNELSGANVSTLGDLLTRGTTEGSTLATDLRTATAANQLFLDQLIKAADMRERLLGLAPPVQLDPETAALPCRALWAPATPAERTARDRLLAPGNRLSQVATVCSQLAGWLSPGAQGSLPLGALLGHRR